MVRVSNSHFKRIGVCSMSCKSALDKLSSNQLKHCLNLGSIMSSFNPSSQQFNKGKLIGYLECLVYMNVITQSESRVLLNYFSDYNYENKKESVG